METGGLTDEEVIESRKMYGDNGNNIKAQNSFFSLFIESFGDPIIKILLIALAIKVLFLFSDANWFETLGILIAVFLASFISTLSEYGSEKAFKRLQESNQNISVKVKRNDILKNVDIKDIVVNDIVILESGDFVPADGRLINGSLYLDESMLNGESKEALKKLGDVLYKGSIVSDGNGILKIDAVGNKTMYGNIQEEVMSKTIDSPLKERLKGLAGVISKIGYVGAILVVISYLFSVIVIKNNFDVNLIMDTLSDYKLMIDYLIYSLTLCVTVIIVAVPEGLPMMVALVLSSNMKRMLKNNVLVRKLVGIETAGSINVLFTDKTGTITEGKLNVIDVLNYRGNSFINDKCKLIVQNSLIYNTCSEFHDGVSIGGNTTDQAIARYIKMNKVDDYEHIVNFNSNTKYSSTKLIKKDIVFYKGANEVIINSSDYYLDDLGYKQVLKDKFHLFGIINNYTKNGYRVLSFAFGKEKKERLCFIGFILIKDSIRESAVEGLGLIKSAGIKTIMITGDDKNTALSIGKDVGLIRSADDLVITSEELNNMSDFNISSIIDKIKIVSRAMPTDKSRLVRIAQSKGLVVGMTGDGVNDAPALKLADVGFAMGSGTEIAKDASDIVILDNNLLSISNAVLFGRTIFKSIRKFVVYQLIVNLCALVLSIIGPIIGVSTPITITQMLWINMIMDTLAGLAFSYEPALKEYMNELPKKRNESIINLYMYFQIILTGIYSALLCLFYLKSSFIYNFYRSDINNIYFMTGFFALFIFIGIFNAFNARTSRINILNNIKKNKVFIIIFLCISFCQIYLIYHGGSLFRTYGLNIRELFIVIFLSISVIPFDMLRKLLFKKFIKYNHL